MKGCCYVSLQVFIVLLGLAAVALFIFSCIRRLWIEAAVAGVLVLLCVHVCILQAERKKLGRQLQQAALAREETAKMRGLEMAEEGAAGHLERSPAQDCPLVPSAVVADDEPQKDLDKAMLNALAKEYMRCSMALQDCRKRYGLLDSKDSDCIAKRIDGRHSPGPCFTMDTASDVNMQQMGELKNMPEDFSGVMPQAGHAARHNSAPQDDKLVGKRPPAAMRGTCWDQNFGDYVPSGHVPDMMDQQAKRGWVEDVDTWGGNARRDNGAGVTQLLPESPRSRPPPHHVQETHATVSQLTLSVRRRQPGQSRQGPPTVTLASRDNSCFNDSRTGPGLAL